MTDIYDIKDVILGFPINFLFSFFVVLLFVFLLFLEKFYKNNKLNKKQEKKDIIETKKIDFFSVLDDFEKKFINLDKKIFYTKLTEILREIIKSKTKKDISKMTFKEINSLEIPKNLKEFIKFSYFREYKNFFEDNKEIRKKIILEIKKII